MSDAMFLVGTGYFDSRRILRQHAIPFRATIPTKDIRTDLWEPATEFPLFATPGTCVVTSTVPGTDDGKTITIQGLDAAGRSQVQDVIIGDPATAFVWRLPLAEILLNGLSGIRTGTAGIVTAAVGGVTAGQILAGKRRSHTGCREVPAGEMWVIERIGVSLIEDAAQGNTSAVVTGALMVARPDALVDEEAEFRISSIFVAASTTRRYFPGDHFFINAESDVDTPGPLVSGTIEAMAFDVKDFT